MAYNNNYNANRYRPRYPASSGGPRRVRPPGAPPVPSPSTSAQYQPQVRPQFRPPNHYYPPRRDMPLAPVPPPQQPRMPHANMYGQNQRPSTSTAQSPPLPSDCPVPVGSYPPLQPPPLPPLELIQYLNADDIQNISSPPPPPPPPAMPASSSRGDSQYYNPTANANAVDASTSSFAVAPGPDNWPWATSTAAAQAQSAAVKKYESPGAELHFVPVTATPDVLNKITNTAATTTEPVIAGKAHAIKLMEADGCVDPNLPKELKEMFEPLFCKLCTISLSSNIVARDHYKGKRHQRAIELWLQEHKIVRNGPSGSNSMPMGQRNIPGYIRDAEQSRKKNEREFEQQKRETMKRVFGERGGPSHRAGGPSGPPPAKNPKKSAAEGSSGSGGGPNFGYCGLCKVNLTSLKSADQHYNGKNHLARLKSPDNPWEDRTFGIGQNFHRRNENDQGKEGANKDSNGEQPPKKPP